ncbi:TPA: hypothetical protein N0F65_004074, partial [Lagenidium giganteum]
MRKCKEVWRLQVRNGVYEHNHVVNEDVYESYPSNRKIRHAETRATADAMIQGHAKRTKIIDYLLGRGEKLNKRDVDNLI